MINIISNQENQIMRGHITPTGWAKIKTLITLYVDQQVAQLELLNPLVRVKISILLGKVRNHIVMLNVPIPYKPATPVLAKYPRDACICVHYQEY